MLLGGVAMQLPWGWSLQLCRERRNIECGYVVAVGMEPATLQEEGGCC